MRTIWNGCLLEISLRAKWLANLPMIQKFRIWPDRFRFLRWSLNLEILVDVFRNAGKHAVAVYICFVKQKLYTMYLLLKVLKFTENFSPTRFSTFLGISFAVRECSANYWQSGLASDSYAIQRSGAKRKSVKKFLFHLSELCNNKCFRVVLAGEDIIDETLMYFKPNIFFRSYEIKVWR